eukprot:3630570-Pleurochrysis_carterae.AAC.1
MSGRESGRIRVRSGGPLRPRVATGCVQEARPPTARGALVCPSNPPCVPTRVGGALGGPAPASVTPPAGLLAACA